MGRIKMNSETILSIADRVRGSSRNLMVRLGYLFAVVAFFMVLSRIGEITPSLRILIWALLLVPVAELAAVTIQALLEKKADSHS